MHVAKWFKRISSNDFQNNLWTFLATGVFSIYIFLLILITTRLVGLAEAGMISFAAAISMLANVVVVFGVRSFQSTDIEQKFAFRTYFEMRVFTALLSALIMTVFMLISRFDSTRSTVIILLFLLFLSDGFADVFMGDLQQKGKMRIAGRMRVSALVSSFVAFTIAVFITRTVIIPLVLSVIVSISVYILWIWFYRTHFGRIRVESDIAAVKAVALSVVPLFLGGLLINYLYNMQKYYLGFLNSDESVAVLSILLIPATALNLFSFSLFGGAEMTKTARLLASGKIKDFSRRINRQILLSLVSAAFFLLCCHIFGLPLLSFIFGTDLSAYSREFFVVVSGGALFAVYAVLFVSLVVIRQQKAYLFSMFAVALVTAPLMLIVVANHGIFGAAFTNLIVLLPLSVMSYIIYRVALRKLY